MTKIDGIGQKFIDFSSKTNGWVLDVGSAFGLVALAALEKGAKVVCNDLSKDHLAFVESKATNLDNLYLLCGDFLALEYEKTFKAIHISRVIHFLEPKLVEKAFELFKKILDEDGKVFLTVETPYLKNWQSFIPVFEHQKAENIEYAGFIDEPNKYESSGYHENLPKHINFFDMTLLKQLADKHGYFVESIEYIDRKGCFPQDLLLDGRESIGLIMAKQRNLNA